MFTFASKTKAQLLLEYNDLDAVSAEFFYIELLSEIKNAVLSDDMDRFKNLSTLLNYIIASNSSEVIQKYEQTALEVVGKVNLIHLACKAGAGKVLEYLLSDQNVNFNLPFQTDSNAISPHDEDDECHNAFYYAIRSNDTGLLEILIDKWPSSYFKDSQKLDDVLSKAFNELLVRNVPLKKDMELYVKKKLVGLRFFNDNSTQKNSSNNPKDLLMLRIEMVLEKIAFIVTNYCDDEKELDEQFLLTAKYVAQNIHILKSQLNFTYDRLPWEEMEFYLIVFIRYCFKAIRFWSWYFFIYPSGYSIILNKHRLLTHLEKFSNRLECVKEELNTIDITKVPSKKITRKDVIQKAGNKIFEDLYNDFTSMRDLYTLMKIKKYTDMALSADPRKKEGHVLISRALQVMGEHLNNTPSSPKLSDTTVDFLLHILPKDLEAVITSLRNSLSHLEAFCLRSEIEDSANVFFVNIQADIAKINVTIADILNRKNISVIMTMLDIVTNQERADGREKIIVEEKSSLEASLTKVLKEFKNSNLKEILQLEKLVLNLEVELDKEISQSKLLFRRLHDVIEERPFENPRQSPDVKSYFDSVFSSGLNGLMKFLMHVLLKSDSTSLLTTNEHFSTDGIIDMDKVYHIITNIFIKNILTKNKSMLDRIKERFMACTRELFPQCDDLLRESLHKMESEDLCKPEQIKIVKMLVTNAEDILESKYRSEKEGFRRILSMIADKKSELLSVQEELSYLFIERRSRMLNMENIYHSFPMFKEDAYKTQKALEPFFKQMDLNSFMNEFRLIFESISSRFHSQYDTEGKSLRKALDDIFDFVKFRMGKIKWIEEFRHMTHNHKKVKPYTFAKNAYTLKPDFAAKLPLKISQLRSVLQNHNLDNLSSEKFQECDKNMELQTLVEMLVLDVLSVIEGLPKQMTHVNFCFDSYYPTIYGRNLRNHLAHGNALVDMLLSEDFANILLNAQKIVDVEDILQKELGKKVENDPVKSRMSHEMDISVAKIQKQFFVALEKGIDEKQVRDFISEGVDIYGRDANSQTALHFAARSPNPKIFKYLATFDLNINVEDDSGQTALHVAANSGRDRIAEYFIEEMKMPVDSKDIHGRTPLHHASGKGHEGVVKLLVKHKVNLLSKDVFGYSPLHYAVLQNHFNVVTLLLENETDVDANQTFYGFTALHLAAGEGHLKLVDHLLEKGAKVNFKSDLDFVALHYAAGGGHFKVVESLLKNGADVNAQTVQGLTPLHSAAQFGDVPTIDILLKHGAKVNASYLDGSTPLHFAVGNGNLAASKLILKKGDNVALRSKDGSTPLDIAATCGHREIVEELLNGADTNSKIQAFQRAASRGHLSVVELLFDCEVDTKLLLDSTALHLAAEEGYTDTAKFLLDRGADINAQDLNGDTALHLSSKKERKELVQLLIEMKADIQIKNNSGYSPLEIIVLKGMTDFLIKEDVDIIFPDFDIMSPFHLAVLNGDTKFVDYCIRKGCPVDLRTKTGETALHLASVGGYVELVSFLIDKGSDIDAEDQKGNHALELSVNAKNKKIIEILIKKGADLSAAKERTLFLSAVTEGHEDIVDFFLSRNPNIGACNSQNNEYPLHEAVTLGHVSIVKKILEKVKKGEINVRDNSSKTPLLIAAEKDHCEIAQLLLSKGSDPGVSSIYGKLPFLVAIEKGSFKMVEIILKPGADYLNKGVEEETSIELAVEAGHSYTIEAHLRKPNIYNITGQNDSSLLHIAASSGSLEIIEYLIDKKADINSRDSSGAKSIHMAAKEGHMDVLEYFLNLGVGVDERGENDWTSMHYAAVGNHTEICKFLFERGADVNAVDAYGSTPLHIAAEKGNFEASLALLEMGAFYDARDKKNKTPLQVTKWWNMGIRISLMFASNMFSAVQSNNIFKLEGVLSLGLDILNFNLVNVKNAKNIAPIHYAAWKGYERVASILLRYKANPNSRTKNDWTSLHYAAKFSHYEIVKDLLNSGAVFEAMSDSSKIPLHYSTDKDVISILELIKNIFRKTENKDRSILECLKAIEDMGVAKTVLRAKNLLNMTLTTVAIANKHPDIDELKEIFQTNVFVPLKMAEMFYMHRNYQESFKSYQVVLQKRLDIFDQADPAIADIQMKLASLLSLSTDYKGALALAQEVYETLKCSLGDRNRETLIAKRIIAVTLQSMGQEQQALSIYEEVSEKQKEVLGIRHRETLGTLTAMAELLYKENKFEIAIKVNEEIFKSLTEYYEFNSFTLRILTNIAKILRKQEKFPTALELFRNISEAKEKLLGWRHQETMESRTEVAATLFFMGEKEESLIILSKYATLQFILLGPNHHDTLKSRSIIADILFSQKKLRAALAIYTEVLSALVLKLGVNHPSLETVRERIGFINSYIKNPVF